MEKNSLNKNSRWNKLKLPPIYDQYYPDVCELNKLMLEENPIKRIKLSDALKHRVFKRIGKLEDEFL